jgi:tRNA(fMet)-specific endonuclease VapC
VNDLHIAGHARSEGLVLVTNNMPEFARVPALEAENWVGQQP